MVTAHTHNVMLTVQLGFYMARCFLIGGVAIQGKIELSCGTD